MDTKTPGQIGEEVSSRGWRQGFIFQPPSSSPLAKLIAANEYFVICTQSCSIASHEECIELVVATPVATFNPRCPEATGKNVRKFHLPIDGIRNVQAICCDITKRQIVPKIIFLELPEPLQNQPNRQPRLDFGTWLGRYYTRAALPNGLVGRLKENFFGTLEDILKQKAADGALFQECLSDIYVSWKPEEDLQHPNDCYTIELLFLCSDTRYEDQLGELLTAELAIYENADGLDGIRISSWEIKSTETTFVADLDNLTRFTEWDHISGMAEVGKKFATR